MQDNNQIPPSIVTEQELKHAINNYQDKADQFVIAGVESSAKVIESCLIILGLFFAFSPSVSKNINLSWFRIVFFIYTLLFFVFYLLYRYRISKFYAYTVSKYMAIGGVSHLGRDYENPLDYRSEIWNAMPKMQKNIKLIQVEINILNILEEILIILFSSAFLIFSYFIYKNI